MYRLVAKILIMSVLLGNFAWAADVHAEKLFGHGVALSSLDGGPADDPVAHGGCDHCCHGASHLLGLAASTTFFTAALPVEVWNLPIGTYTSVAFSPPTPPPNA